MSDILCKECFITAKCNKHYITRAVCMSKRFAEGEINSLRGEVQALTSERDMWRAVAEKLSEELAHNRICVDALESYKDCEEHTKFFISCNKCWLDHFKSLIQETTK